MREFPEQFALGKKEDEYQEELRKSELVVNYPNDDANRMLHGTTCYAISYELTKDNPNRDPKVVLTDQNELETWMKKQGIESIPICKKNPPCRSLIKVYGEAYRAGDMPHDK